MERCSPCRSRSLKSSVATSSPSHARERPAASDREDFGISEGCLHRWSKITDREDGIDTGCEGFSNGRVRATATSP